MSGVSDLDQALEEAQRAARQPVEDRLHGTAGPDAENAAVRLMTVAGLPYRDAIRITSALYWQGWNDHRRQTADKLN